MLFLLIRMIGFCWFMFRLFQLLNMRRYVYVGYVIWLGIFSCRNLSKRVLLGVILFDFQLKFLVLTVVMVLSVIQIDLH